MPQTISTRWSPAPEQLMILEEMYRSGLTTPNASQIQQITAHLSYYGKIEGKNVFYWFQNHKARDRQKLRRRISRQPQPPPPSLPPWPQYLHFHNFDDSSLLPPHFQPQFYHQFLPQAPGMDLLGKLEAATGGGGGGQEAVPSSSTSSSGNGSDWAKVLEPIYGQSPSSRPLKTLELFPTRSTGRLKDECRTFKSSPCSSSTV